MKITTCIPKQKNTFDEKFNWLEEQLKNKTDIFITPQEYFGGDYIMPDETSFEKKDLLPKLEKLSKDTNTALVIGVIEKVTDQYNQEKMWFIDEYFKGEVVKFAEPNYTVLGKGSYKLKPEDDLDKRFVTFPMKGINVAGYFCWEVFGDLLMAGIGMLEPDLVVSQIKFGIAGYPKNKKNKKGLVEVESIQWCGGDIWLERLIHASKFEVMAPIACSTNSWDLRARFKPLVGLYYPYKEMNGHEVTNEELEKDIVITDEINFEEVRGLRENKFEYLRRVGEFPPYSINEYTMMFKIHRIIKRMQGDTLAEKSAKNMKKMKKELFKELTKQRFYKKKLNK